MKKTMAKKAKIELLLRFRIDAPFLLHLLQLQLQNSARQLERSAPEREVNNGHEQKSKVVVVPIILVCAGSVVVVVVVFSFTIGLRGWNTSDRAAAL